MRLVATLLINALALILTDKLLPGFEMVGQTTPILAAIILGLINTFIRPILLFLTAPLNILSLGLFTFVVNAIVLSIAGWIMGEAFILENFWWAILAAAVLSVISTAISHLVKDLEHMGSKKKK